MSLELKDFRGKITPETDAVLEAMNRVGGVDRSEIARKVLHEWALQKINEASVLNKLMVTEGLGGISGGKSGNPRES